MPSKSIHVVSSYTVLKLGRFLRHCMFYGLDIHVCLIQYSGDTEGQALPLPVRHLALCGPQIRREGSQIALMFSCLLKQSGVH